jgi:hypothetical protein
MIVAKNVCRRARRPGEGGGGRVNFLVFLLLVALAAYSAYNYAPVSYNAYLYKDFMQETVNRAAYPPGQSSEWVTQQLRTGLTEYNLPEDAQISVQNEGGRIVARAKWTRAIPLPGYIYQYNFDHTARRSGFINP